MSRRLRWVAAGCAAALIAVVALVVALWGPGALEPAGWVAGIAGVAVAVFAVFVALWPADAAPPPPAPPVASASTAPPEAGPPASSGEPGPPPRIVVVQRAEARGKAQIRQAGRDLTEE